MLFAVLLAGSVVAQEPEPANLFPHKQEVRRYVDSGAYLEAITTVAASASAWIENRARLTVREKSGTHSSEPRLAVVLDLDETLISNLPSILKQDFGYVSDAWLEWVQRGEAPAIEPVRQIYEKARRLHLSVFILSGRRERDRAATERNLKAIGCADYTSLILEPNDLKISTGVFKRDERRRLLSEGFVLIANIGDQESDFLEGGAERNFKLPNPFYITD